jgi:hypothetical protein
LASASIGKRLPRTFVSGASTTARARVRSRDRTRSATGQGSILERHPHLSGPHLPHARNRKASRSVPCTNARYRHFPGNIQLGRTPPNPFQRANNEGIGGFASFVGSGISAMSARRPRPCCGTTTRRSAAAATRATRSSRWSEKLRVSATAGRFSSSSRTHPQSNILGRWPPQASKLGDPCAGRRE